jgi:hypothetical protein
MAAGLLQISVAYRKAQHSARRWLGPPLSPGCLRSVGSDGLDSQQRCGVQERLRRGTGGLCDPPRSVHYWDRHCRFIPLISARQMGTHYSIWQFEMGILCMASAQNLALGPFLLRADHLVFEGRAFGIVSSSHFSAASVVARTLICPASPTCSRGAVTPGVSDFA